jgi:hypothetical protein
LYTLAKLGMNGLYGKNLQRPIFTNTAVIKSTSEYWKFWGENVVQDVTAMSESLWHVSGSPRSADETADCITKPTHLGAFILSYSRRIMWNYMKQANPYFDISHDPSPENKKLQKENDFYYTDTDSIQMKQTNAHLIPDLGRKSLGGITDDLGDNCKVIRGLWIAPKLYMLEYLRKDKDGQVSVHHHFRGKGLNTQALNCGAFEAMAKGNALVNTRDFSMKKINISRNSKQKDIPMFSIIHNSGQDQGLTRTVNKTPWAGRKFSGNTSVPWV